MTDPKNPRTSRVAVNRVWQNHFGKGICASSSDFGYLGDEPTHPELLDWLATEFVNKGWRLKAQRMIMFSNTYKMSSRSQEEGLKKDAKQTRLEIQYAKDECRGNSR